MTDFSDQFRKIIMRYKRIDHNLNVMRQSACLVINPITLMAMLHSLIARRWIGRQTPRVHDLKLLVFILVGLDRSFRLLLGSPGLN